jgi:hypothetical protein
MTNAEGKIQMKHGFYLQDLTALELTRLDSRNILQRPKTLRGCVRYTLTSLQPLAHFTFSLTTCDEEVLSAIKSVFGGAKVVQAIESLGFETSTGIIISTQILECQIVFALLQSLAKDFEKNPANEPVYPANITISCPG